MTLPRESSIDLRLTPQELAALIGACGMAGYGFAYGSRPDPDDPGCSLLAKAQRALKDYSNGERSEAS